MPKQPNAKINADLGLHLMRTGDGSAARASLETSFKGDAFKSNTLTKKTNTNSVPVYYAQAFGPGAVGAGISEMPRVMPHTNDNFGEMALVIWLMYAGFEVFDSRFIASIRTT